MGLKILEAVDSVDAQTPARRRNFFLPLPESSDRQGVLAGLFRYLMQARSDLSAPIYTAMNKIDERLIKVDLDQEGGLVEGKSELAKAFKSGGVVFIDISGVPVNQLVAHNTLIDDVARYQDLVLGSEGKKPVIVYVGEPHALGDDGGNSLSDRMALLDAAPVPAEAITNPKSAPSPVEYSVNLCGLEDWRSLLLGAIQPKPEGGYQRSPSQLQRQASGGSSKKGAGMSLLIHNPPLDPQARMDLHLFLLTLQLRKQPAEVFQQIPLQNFQYEYSVIKPFEGKGSLNNPLLLTQDVVEEFLNPQIVDVEDSKRMLTVANPLISGKRQSIDGVLVVDELSSHSWQQLLLLAQAGGTPVRVIDASLLPKAAELKNSVGVMKQVDSWGSGIQLQGDLNALSASDLPASAVILPPSGSSLSLLFSFKPVKGVDYRVEQGPLLESLMNSTPENPVTLVETSRENSLLFQQPGLLSNKPYVRLGCKTYPLPESFTINYFCSSDMRLPIMLHKSEEGSLRLPAPKVSKLCEDGELGYEQTLAARKQAISQGLAATHGLFLEGSSGCGKSYIAEEWLRNQEDLPYRGRIACSGHLSLDEMLEAEGSPLLTWLQEGGSLVIDEADLVLAGTWEFLRKVLGNHELPQELQVASRYIAIKNPQAKRKIIFTGNGLSYAGRQHHHFFNDAKMVTKRAVNPYSKSFYHDYLQRFHEGVPKDRRLELIRSIASRTDFTLRDVDEMVARVLQAPQVKTSQVVNEVLNGINPVTALSEQAALPQTMKVAPTKIALGLVEQFSRQIDLWQQHSKTAKSIAVVEGPAGIGKDSTLIGYLRTREDKVIVHIGSSGINVVDDALPAARQTAERYPNRISIILLPEANALAPSDLEALNEATKEHGNLKVIITTNMATGGSDRFGFTPAFKNRCNSYSLPALDSDDYGALIEFLFHQSAQLKSLEAREYVRGFILQCFNDSAGPRSLRVLMEAVDALKTWLSEAVSPSQADTLDFVKNLFGIQASNVSGTGVTGSTKALSSAAAAPPPVVPAMVPPPPTESTVPQGDEGGADEVTHLPVHQETPGSVGHTESVAEGPLGGPNLSPPSKKNWLKLVGKTLGYLVGVAALAGGVLAILSGFGLAGGSTVLYFWITMGSVVVGPFIGIGLRRIFPRGRQSVRGSSNGAGHSSDGAFKLGAKNEIYDHDHKRLDHADIRDESPIGSVQLGEGSGVKELILYTYGSHYDSPNRKFQTTKRKRFKAPKGQEAGPTIKFTPHQIVWRRTIWPWHYKLFVPIPPTMVGTPKLRIDGRLVGDWKESKQEFVINQIFGSPKTSPVEIEYRVGTSDNSEINIDHPQSQFSAADLEKIAVWDRDIHTALTAVGLDKWQRLEWIIQRLLSSAYGPVKLQKDAEVFNRAVEELGEMGAVIGARLGQCRHFIAVAGACANHLGISNETVGCFAISGDDDHSVSSPHARLAIIDKDGAYKILEVTNPPGGRQPYQVSLELLKLRPRKIGPVVKSLSGKIRPEFRKIVANELQFPGQGAAVKRFHQGTLGANGIPSPKGHQGGLMSVLIGLDKQDKWITGNLTSLQLPLQTSNTSGSHYFTLPLSSLFSSQIKDNDNLRRYRIPFPLGYRGECYFSVPESTGLVFRKLTDDEITNGVNLSPADIAPGSAIVMAVEAVDSEKQVHIQGMEFELDEVQKFLEGLAVAELTEANAIQWMKYLVGKVETKNDELMLALLCSAVLSKFGFNHHVGIGWSQAQLRSHHPSIGIMLNCEGKLRFVPISQLKSPAVAPAHPPVAAEEPESSILSIDHIAIDGSVKRLPQKLSSPILPHELKLVLSEIPSLAGGVHAAGESDQGLEKLLELVPSLKTKLDALKPKPARILENYSLLTRILAEYMKGGYELIKLYNSLPENTQSTLEGIEQLRLKLIRRILPEEFDALMVGPYLGVKNANVPWEVEGVRLIQPQALTDPKQSSVPPVSVKDGDNKYSETAGYGSMDGFQLPSRSTIDSDFWSTLSFGPVVTDDKRPGFLPGLCRQFELQLEPNSSRKVLAVTLTNLEWRFDNSNQRWTAPIPVPINTCETPKLDLKRTEVKNIEFLEPTEGSGYRVTVAGANNETPPVGMVSYSQKIVDDRKSAHLLRALLDNSRTYHMVKGDRKVFRGSCSRGFYQNHHDPSSDDNSITMTPSPKHNAPEEVEKVVTDYTDRGGRIEELVDPYSTGVDSLRAGEFAARFGYAFPGLKYVETKSPKPLYSPTPTGLPPDVVRSALGLPAFPIKRGTKRSPFLERLLLLPSSDPTAPSIETVGRQLEEYGLRPYLLEPATRRYHWNSPYLFVPEYVNLKNPVELNDFLILNPRINSLLTSVGFPVSI